MVGQYLPQTNEKCYSELQCFPTLQCFFKGTAQPRSFFGPKRVRLVAYPPTAYCSISYLLNKEWVGTSIASDTCATISLHIVSSVISFQITLVLALALSGDAAFR